MNAQSKRLLRIADSIDGALNAEDDPAVAKWVADLRKVAEAVEEQALDMKHLKREIHYLTTG